MSREEAFGELKARIPPDIGEGKPTPPEALGDEVEVLAEAARILGRRSIDEADGLMWEIRYWADKHRERRAKGAGKTQSVEGC